MGMYELMNFIEKTVLGGTLLLPVSVDLWIA